MNEPIRQCIVCRQKKVKRELLRIVRTCRGNVEFDPNQKKEGRGLYVCANLPCIQNAQSKDLVSRSFGKQIPVSLYIRMAEHFRDREGNSFQGLLGLAARARSLLIGLAAVERGAKKGRVRIIILDAETKGSTRKRVEAVSFRTNVPVITYPGVNSLEKVVGKVNCRCVGITDAEFARSILQLSDVEMKIEKNI